MLVYTNPSVRNGATTLTVNQMPSHTHTVIGGTYHQDYTTYVAVNARLNYDTYNRAVSATGGSQAHAHSISATCQSATCRIC